MAPPHAIRNRSTPGRRILLSPECLQGAAADSRNLFRGLLVAGAGFTTEPPLHCPSPNASTTLLYCLRGKGLCQVGGRLLPVRKGDLVLLPPQPARTCTASPREPWTFYWLQAVGEQLGAYLALLKLSETTPVLHVGEDAQVMRLFDEVLQALLRGQDMVHLVEASNGLAYLLSILAGKRQETPQLSADAAEKVAQAIISMSERIAQPLRVSHGTLCRRRSRSTASRACCASRLTTPGKWSAHRACAAARSWKRCSKPSMAAPPRAPNF